MSSKMNIQNGRPESQENQGVPPRDAAKDILMPARRAFADLSLNIQAVAPKAEAPKPAPAAAQDAVQMLQALLKAAATNPVVVPEEKKIEPKLSAVDFADDVHAYLLSKEADFVHKNDIMAGKVVTTRMRGILIDWLVQVHGRFHLSPETLHLTVYLIDCAIDRLNIPKSELQLVGVAAMMVASKFEDTDVPDISDCEFITDYTYRKRHIIKMEIKILQACDIYLSRPHSITFLRWLSKELGFTGSKYVRAKYFCEIALIDYAMIAVLPSQVAAISLYMTARLTETDVDINKMMGMIGWSRDEMLAGAHLLAQATLRLHSQEKLVALLDKFSIARNFFVSEIRDEEFDVLESM